VGQTYHWLPIAFPSRPSFVSYLAALPAYAVDYRRAPSLTDMSPKLMKPADGAKNALTVASVKPQRHDAEEEDGQDDRGRVR
jgi:hypothetical protein